MDQLKLTGGARIGFAKASWPLVTLIVNKDQMELNASIIGNLVFRPADIISIETYSQFPIIGQGIKINHRVENYNQKVIFWTFNNPSVVINQIKQTGFLNNVSDKITANDQLIIDQQRSGGFPIKMPVVVIAIVLWNILFLSDIVKSFTSGKGGFPLSNGALTAVGLLFTTSILTLISEDFSRLILKEGRTIKDIRSSLYLIIFISGFLFIGFLLTKSLG
ncbi:hypothetical protein [Solitalea canadensis]|uniref:Uncharacterized protein n=1 Tax=Solitalea canadensis (strain ATCC 29591 / DSM 3403 / JCM 21819 / LMG 8368 / NBRC 15130 / NCIMB 12057 / USAM 9D) TaxID=929556 RepID=H8KPH1_SOLCM|nr:hypothetical protein [Solitalea canadensis]AFD05869.1 hypothetical protein Solca_0750 [Solitalea canadensis DSM 3403]